MGIDAKEVEARERLAIDEVTRERKRGRELAGEACPSGDRIEREVKKDVEEIARQRDHEIYKGR